MLIAAIRSAAAYVLVSLYVLIVGPPGMLFAILFGWKNLLYELGRFGIEEGSLVIAEEREDGILIRPAVALPVETYTPRRRAEFLLSNAVDRQDYGRAVREVRKMGLDPERVPHHKPPK